MIFLKLNVIMTLFDLNKAPPGGLVNLNHAPNELSDEELLELNVQVARMLRLMLIYASFLYLEFRPSVTHAQGHDFSLLELVTSLGPT
jgi:hypothetical protein